MGILDVINEVGIVAVIGVIVWLIRLEGVVKRNKEEIGRLSGIEQQTADQEVRISERDAEMRALKHSMDEVKGRMEKLESQQVNTVERLARMDTKLDLLLGVRKGETM